MAMRQAEQGDDESRGCQRHKDGHRVGEPGELELQLRGGLARAREGPGAQPQAPGEIAGAGRADERRERVLDAEQPVGRHRVEEVDGDVIAAQGHQRQAREDEGSEQHLGELEAARDRLVQEIAPEHVDAGEQHQAEHQRRGDGAEHRHDRAVETGHAPDYFFWREAISARSALSTAAPSTPLGLAFFSIHSFSRPAVLALISAISCGLAMATGSFASCIAARPLASAASHASPERRASASPSSGAMSLRSASGIEFHFAGFAIQTKAVLYRPPGTRVAYLISGMNLNERGDSFGKNTPSATPEESSS